MVPWAHPSPQPKRHLDRFSRFCTAHWPADRQTVTIHRICIVRSTAMWHSINKILLIFKPMSLQPTCFTCWRISVSTNILESILYLIVLCFNGNKIHVKWLWILLKTLAEIDVGSRNMILAHTSVRCDRVLINMTLYSVLFACSL